MDIQHKLNQCTLKLGELAAKYHEPGLREFRCNVKIHRTAGGSQINVIKRLELEGLGFAPGSQQRVIRFVCSVGYVFIWKIGNGCKITLQLARNGIEFSFFCL